MKKRVSKAKVVARLERALEQLGKVNAARQYREWPIPPEKLERLGALVAECHPKLVEAKGILENHL